MKYIDSIAAKLRFVSKRNTDCLTRHCFSTVCNNICMLNRQCYTHFYRPLARHFYLRNSILFLWASKTSFNENRKRNRNNEPTWALYSSTLFRFMVVGCQLSCKDNNRLHSLQSAQPQTNTYFVFGFSSKIWIFSLRLNTKYGIVTIGHDIIL